eukprot:tig00021537_g22313.t1
MQAFVEGPAPAQRSDTPPHASSRRRSSAEIVEDELEIPEMIDMRDSVAGSCAARSGGRRTRGGAGGGGELRARLPGPVAGPRGRVKRYIVTEESLPEQQLRQFRREAGIMRRCEHPSVMRMHGVCTRPVMAIVMEFCSGAPSRPASATPPAA